MRNDKEKKLIWGCPAPTDVPYVCWEHDGVIQIVAFANTDDAKLCEQTLINNGISAGFSVPEGHKEIPHKHYEGDGLLSDDEMVALKARLDNMVLVTR